MSKKPSKKRSSSERKTANVNAAVTPSFKRWWEKKADEHKKFPSTMAREALEKHITTL